jgi:hypothetical protein
MTHHDPPHGFPGLLLCCVVFITRAASSSTFTITQRDRPAMNRDE